jgi:hypothetical protein
MVMSGLQDSVVCYQLDCAFGLPDATGTIQRKIQARKNAPWQTVNLPVPQSWVAYNANKGTIDAVDKTRDGKLGLGVNYRTNKWTIKFEENLWDLACTQSYNIYRANHRTKEEGFIEHKFFQLEVFDYFLHHPLARAHKANNNRRERGIREQCGELVQFERGSRGDSVDSNRRKRRVCQGPAKFHRDKDGKIIYQKKCSTFCAGCGVILCSATCSKHYHIQVEKNNTVKPQKRRTFARNTRPTTVLV